MYFLFLIYKLVLFINSAVTRGQFHNAIEKMIPNYVGPVSRYWTSDPLRTGVLWNQSCQLLFFSVKNHSPDILLEVDTIHFMVMVGPCVMI